MRSFASLPLLFVLNSIRVEALLVGPDLAACELKGTKIFCDFSDTNEAVQIEEILDTRSGKQLFQSADIKNAKSLQADKPMCIDLFLKNIPSVNFSPSVVCHKRDLYLLLDNSKMLRNPYLNFRAMSLRNSTINKISTDTSRLIDISDSNIQEFKISNPSYYGNNKIKNSFIGTFSLYQIGRRGRLHIFNTEINNMESRCLIIGQNTVLTLDSVTITNSAEDAIVLKEGSKLILKNVMGEVNFITEDLDAEDIDGHLPPGVPPRKIRNEDGEFETTEGSKGKCRKQNPLAWIVPTVFVVVELVIIFFLLSRISKLAPKGQSSNIKPDFETGYDNFNIQVDPYSTQGVPVGYYNEKDPNLIRKR